MRIGDQVYAMSDNGAHEGECVVVAGRTFEDTMTRAVGDEIDSEADWLLVRWTDDNVTQSLVAFNWSFVPAIPDRHEEYNA